MAQRLRYYAGGQPAQEKTNMSTMLMVKVSPELKAAIEEAAKAGDKSMSEYVREAVAQAIGYDMSSDEMNDALARPKRYVTEEARKQARRDAERERQQQRTRVRLALERKAREEGAASLEEWLRRRGIQVDDAPATTTTVEAEKISA